jgi:hypothetical protein
MCRAIASWIVACNNKKRLRGEREREREKEETEKRKNSVGPTLNQVHSLFFFLSSLIAS